MQASKDRGPVRTNEAGAAPGWPRGKVSSIDAVPEDFMEFEQSYEKGFEKKKGKGRGSTVSAVLREEIAADESTIRITREMLVLSLVLLALSIAINFGMTW
jgi:hypothetical protein